MEDTCCRGMGANSKSRELHNDRCSEKLGIVRVPAEDTCCC